jgi:DNA-binding Lrp family transcriptional regulator
MSKTLTDLDREVLEAIQDEIPLVPEPWKALGEKLGLSETDVLERVRAHKASGVARQISAIFDTKSLGFRGALVAAQVPRERLVEVAEAINSHPGVSHNYQRTGRPPRWHFEEAAPAAGEDDTGDVAGGFNLWFTVAVPPDQDLEWTLDRLATETGTQMRTLPTLRLYKIGVRLDVTGKQAIDARTDLSREYTEARRGKAGPITPFDRDVVLALQDDLPLERRPYAAAAEARGLDPDRVLAGATSLHQRGALRRVAAVLRHREAGYRSNAMGVWAVPQELCDEIGPRMAAFRRVSHCYRRPVYPDWPYSVFTMVHGERPEHCEQVLAAIEKETGIAERAVLWSGREFRKIRLRYFTDDYARWARSRGWPEAEA